MKKLFRVYSGMLTCVSMTMVMLLSAKCFSQNVIMPSMGSQIITTCCEKFYDSGDSLVNYSNNENGQITFFPATTGYLITLTFTYFSVADAGDILTIYSTSGPLLGTYSVGGMPPCNTITSTDTVNGGLTMSFISNGSGTSGGWRARVSCVMDTIYAYPNGINCANPYYYAGFQYSATCQTTECFGDDYTSSTSGVCSANFSSGEDKIYYYPVSGNGNLHVVVSNISTLNCGLFLYYFMCPPATGNCFRLDTTVVNGELCVDMAVSAGNQLYIIVDTWAPPSYVDYDINLSLFGVCLPSGEDEMEQTGRNIISVFPNPATTEITVQSSKLKVESVEVWDVVGRRVGGVFSLTPSPSPFGEGGALIDVSKLVAGIYFVKVRDGKGNVAVGKFVKE